MYEAPIVMAIYKLHGGIPISRASKGNENWLENSGVRNIGGIRNYSETNPTETTFGSLTSRVSRENDCFCDLFK